MSIDFKNNIKNFRTRSPYYYLFAGVNNYNNSFIHTQRGFTKSYVI